MVPCQDSLDVLLEAINFACRVLPFKLGARYWYAGMRENITQPYQYVLPGSEGKWNAEEKEGAPAV